VLQHLVSGSSRCNSCWRQAVPLLCICHARPVTLNPISFLTRSQTAFAQRIRRVSYYVKSITDARNCPPCDLYQHAENVFDDDASNELVFEHSGASKVVESFLQGYSGTVFVYGQTGAGKTHTMSAFTTLAANQIFGVHKDATSPPPQLSVSVLEVYNDNIRDLQGPEGAANCLQVCLRLAHLLRHPPTVCNCAPVRPLGSVTWFGFDACAALKTGDTAGSPFGHLRISLLAGRACHRWGAFIIFRSCL
jgi:hypothetical protein